MRKLLVTCECGQQMQVPRSALGKMGMCPTCGQTTRISSDNTSALPPRSAKNKAKAAGAARLNRPSSWSSGPSAPREDAKQRFGLAVDHYYAGRYAQALAVFDGLAKKYPDNSEIERGCEQCLAAIHGEKVSGSLPPGVTVPLLSQSKLDGETVRRIVLEKLVNGSSDEVQLHAAEIASRLLGLGAFGGHSTSAPAESATPATEPVEANNPAAASPGSDNIQRNGNGHGAIGEPEILTGREDSEVESS